MFSASFLWPGNSLSPCPIVLTRPVSDLCFPPRRPAALGWSTLRSSLNLSIPPRPLDSRFGEKSEPSEMPLCPFVFPRLSERHRNRDTESKHSYLQTHSQVASISYPWPEASIGGRRRLLPARVCAVAGSRDLKPGRYSALGTGVHPQALSHGPQHQLPASAQPEKPS